ncbi:MAG: tetratricopeptide repeat protein, partial [candidate division Zixibacteria bacterium]|nr:tetratricopeptide repeat protein [candidate division Zixibacteria bacterium]
RFPNNVVAHTGRAEILKAFSRFDEALIAFEETIKRFPNNVVAYNGRAEVLKAVGRFDEALKAYEESIDKFPNNVVARNGRAEVLKAVGRFDEALKAYEETIDKFPYDIVAQNGLASVLAAIGKYKEALNLVSIPKPKSLSEWIAYHIKGVILLKIGEIDSAIKVFQNGIENNPWAAESPYFQTALAVAQIRKSKYNEAADILQNLSLPELKPVAKVLSIHAYGELNDFIKAKDSYESIEFSCPPAITALRDELKERFIIRDTNRVLKSDEWLFKRECDALLIAA